MQYKTVSRMLEKSHSRSEIANFFLNPVLYPDLVMTVLIEKKKGGRSAAAKKASPRRMFPIPSKPHPVRPPLSKSPFRLAMRTLVILSMFMFLSCAIAPNHGLFMDESDDGLVFSFDDGGAFEVESLQKAKQTTWEVATNMLLDIPLPASAANSFAAFLLGGRWAGIALIDEHGGLKALAREEAFDSISDWVDRYRVLDDENRVLRESIEALRKARESKKSYLEINLEDNLLFVKMGAQVLYEFPIVSGKGYTPRESNRRRSFSTPRGILSVTTKEKNPIWHPPVWHWTERGLEAPAVRPAIRGVLGNYRLNLGHGYGIHGTAAGRIRPGKYSHGCIRMNNKDIEIVYKLIDVGAEVYIY